MKSLRVDFLEYVSTTHKLCLPRVIVNFDINAKIYWYITTYINIVNTLKQLS